MGKGTNQYASTSICLDGDVDELACGRVEGKADEPDWTPRGDIRLGVALLADLSERLVRRLADIQLEDAYLGRMLRNDVRTSVAVASRLFSFSSIRNSSSPHAV